MTAKMLTKINLSEYFIRNLQSAGFIIISAFKGASSDPEDISNNRAQNEILKNKVKSSKYQFLPLWGEYYEGEDVGGFLIKEALYVVFNNKRNGGLDGHQSQEDILELKTLAESWCHLFGQDAYFCKEEASSTEGHYINASGEILQTSDEVRPLEAADQYLRLRNKNAEKTRTLSYVEGVLYSAGQPTGLSNRMMRHGEVFID